MEQRRQENALSRLTRSRNRILAYAFLSLGVVAILLGGGMRFLAAALTHEKGPLDAVRVFTIVGLGVAATGLLAAGRFAINRCRKCAHHSQELLAQDLRPPVLYLRAFLHDPTAAKVVAFGEGLAGEAGFVNFIAPPIYSEEEQLAEVFNEIGPFVAIGRPGETLPLLAPPGCTWSMIPGKKRLPI